MNERRLRVHWTAAAESLRWPMENIPNILDDLTKVSNVDAVTFTQISLVSFDNCMMILSIIVGQME